MRRFLIFFALIFSLNANISVKEAITNSNLERLDNIINSSIYNIYYENYVTYQKISEQLLELQEQLKTSLNSMQKDELERKILTLQEQQKLLNDYKDLRFAQNLSAPESVEVSAKLTNPLMIISAFSHIKQLKNEKAEYSAKFKDFESLVQSMREKNEELKNIADKEASITNLQNLSNSVKKLDEFEQALQFAKVSFGIYEKKVDDELARVSADIKAQILQTANILIIIFLSIAIAFSLKFIAKRYIHDIERYYIAAKIINVFNINIIFLILLFAYIENITYLVTILGFASAGLAIAMKDMFMSMLGWCVIIFGGSFRTGDRVKVMQGDLIYIGDIIDISLLRITIHEDITLESYTKNRRAGRIIFIPNNYIFTNLIANYTHHGMKTVLDGIDITITFDSNLEKAQRIIEQIVIKHSKSYTNIAKKTFAKLQNEYSLKDPKAEPRFYVFFEHWGMRISSWYMTNSYATLGLRSVICKEIIKELNKESDIKIAYPSQNLQISKRELPKFES